MTQLRSTDILGVGLARAGASAAPDHAQVRDTPKPLKGRTITGLGLVWDVQLMEPHRFGDCLGLKPRDWQAFEAVAGATVFQSWRWLEAWTRFAAAPIGEHPVIAIGRRASGETAVILPLARVEKLGRPVLAWLGASHGNYARPIAAPAVFDGATAADVVAVIDAIAMRAGADAIYLNHQPATWQQSGTSAGNPLAEIRPIAAPNDAYLLTLADAFEPQYNALFSAKTRSQLRRKMRRLGELGAVSLASAATLDERLRLLDVFIDQKRVQLSAQGASSVFDRPEIRAFYRDLADDRNGTRAGLQIMSLSVDTRVAATVLSMRHCDRAYMLNTSFSADADLKDASPGKLLIHAHVADCHASGVRTYDFGPGEAAYKSDWQATAAPLSALVRGVTLTGAAVALALGSGLRAKRIIKRTPKLWRAAQATRRVLAGRRITSA